MRRLFAFPNPVNEKAARTVAAGVVVLALLALATGWTWLVVLIAAGFVARVLTGPTLSPLGRLAMDVVGPRLGAPKHVSGPPKRFAQGMGAVMTTVAATLAVTGHHGAADVLLWAIVAAAGLESSLGFCVGCKVFGLLMRAGVIPDEICADCADIWTRPGMQRP
jgi:hypothetical protein